MAEYYITAKKRDPVSGKIIKYIVRKLVAEGLKKFVEEPVVCSPSWIVEQLLTGNRFYTAEKVDEGWKRGELVDFRLTTFTIGRPTHNLEHLPDIK